MVSSNYSMRLVVYNEANPAPGVLVNFTNTVVADVDFDGIPDAVEQGLGLNPNNAADGALDLDGDAMSNRNEFLAGTDPADPSSYLEVVPAAAAAGVAQVTFLAVSNRTYSVQFTDALEGGSWSKLADVLARPVSRVETRPDPGWTTNRFYRLVLPSQP
jgi:hypothetical protein